MKYIYNTGRNGPNSLRGHYAQNLVDVVPQLKDVDVLAMEWDQLEEIGMVFATGNLNRQRGPYLRDLTMMGKDYEMFINSSTVSTNDCRASFIVHSHDTKIQNLSSFLQSKPHKNEVRILCIIGHGISEEQAKQLNENPPAFDNNQCKDSRKMKSCRWKWPLTNCNGKEGLGKGYTARSVCENARKGDIVVFESGFLTPEWVVEQLRTRELSTFFGWIPFTLVLLVDSCYSGVWTERIRTKLKLQNTRLVVQTSCAADEESYGQYFIPLWCALQKESNQSNQEEYAEEELDFKQTPTYYDSHGNEPIEGLKFFPTGHLLRPKFRDCTDKQSRAIGEDLLEEISLGKGKICSYKLKHHKSGKPQAFFLVEIDSKKIHLHIHFDNFVKFTVTQINLYECTETMSYMYRNDYLYQNDYFYRKNYWYQKVCEEGMYKEEKETRKELKFKESNEITRNITRLCSNHVRCYWWDENCWHMKNTVPPNVIRSRSALLKSKDPTEQATVI